MFDKSSTNTPKCNKIVPHPKLIVYITNKIIGKFNICHENGTLNNSIRTIIKVNDIKNLNKNTNDFDTNKIYLGKYTLFIVPILFFTSFTLPLTVLLNKSHVVSPINTNTGKYCSVVLNTTSTINVYISMYDIGSKNHHNQLRYELVISDFSSAFAAYTEYL